MLFPSYGKTKNNFLEGREKSNSHSAQHVRFMQQMCSLCQDGPVSLSLFLCRFTLLGCLHSGIELLYYIVEEWVSCWSRLRFNVGQDKILYHIMVSRATVAPWKSQIALSTWFTSRKSGSMRLVGWCWPLMSGTVPKDATNSVYLL